MTGAISTQRAARESSIGSISTQRSVHDRCTAVRAGLSSGIIFDIESCQLEFCQLEPSPSETRHLEACRLESCCLEACCLEACCLDSSCWESCCLKSCLLKVLLLRVLPLGILSPGFRLAGLIDFALGLADGLMGRAVDVASQQWSAPWPVEVHRPKCRRASNLRMQDLDASDVVASTNIDTTSTPLLAWRPLRLTSSDTDVDFSGPT